MASATTSARIQKRARTPHPIERGYFSYETAADYLSVSVPSIKYWAGQGLLIGFRMGKRFRRFSRAELDALAERLRAEGEVEHAS